MPAKILIVDDDPATLTWLKTKFESEEFQVTTATTAQDALRQIAADAPQVVVFETVLPDLTGVEFLRRVAERGRGASPWMIVLSKKYQPQDIAAGFEAGADDYVGKRPGADVELIGKIRGHLAQARKSARPPANQGHILAFCSSKGGTGTTSVCVNVACALAQLERTARVLVMDMVLPLGTIGLMLGYDSQKTIARLTQEMTDEPDRALLDRYCSIPLKWRFRVLLGAHDPQESNALDVSRIVPLFETLRTMYDYILVDFGRSLSRISLPIIEMSERVLLIVTPDMSTLKGARVIKDYLAARDVPEQRIF